MEDQSLRKIDRTEGDFVLYMRNVLIESVVWRL